MLNLPVRPPFSLGEILFYTFLSFAIALALTPWFVAFLRRYKLGKQLRVEAMDGGSASVFLTYHKSKAGTPTMGGLLIWGSILITVLISRLLSLWRNKQMEIEGTCRGRLLEMVGVVGRDDEKTV
jgi:phospho-N-acetylmuramoyl-pentapeptide-transferase